MLSCRITPGEFARGVGCCRLALFHRSGADGRVRRYPSDTTDAQWAVIDALLPDPAWLGGQGGRREVHCRRVIVDGFNRLGLSCFEPRGAFYAFPSIKSSGLTDEEFSERLLMEEKVAVVPGSAFGTSGAGHVRASYATSLPNIEEALNRIERFLGKL